MIIQSPRSYVTRALDMLFPSLTEYVYKKLSDSKSRNWWEYYIRRTSRYVFADEDLRDTLPIEGGRDDLRLHFDEHKLCRLVLSREVKYENVFSKSIEKQFEKLKDVRNKWAHRDIQTVSQASKAFEILISFADAIEEDDVSQKLDALHKHMKRKAQPKCSAQVLKNLLEDRVFTVIELSPFYVTNKELKRILSSSRKTLASTETAEEVVEFFWNAIIEKSYAYDTVISLGLPTFEDIRYEFDIECYGYK